MMVCDISEILNIIMVYYTSDLIITDDIDILWANKQSKEIVKKEILQVTYVVS